MSIYPGLYSTALNLLSQFGKPATLSPTTSTHNPVTGEVTTTAGSAATFNVIEVSAEEAFGRSLQNVNLEALYLLADASQVLKPGQNITVNGTAHEIKKARPIRPGGIVLMYGLEVVA